MSAGFMSIHLPLYLVVCMLCTAGGSCDRESTEYGHSVEEEGHTGLLYSQVKITGVQAQACTRGQCSIEYFVSVSFIV